VIPAGFDEICRNNMTKSGVLLLCLPIGKVAELQDIVETDTAPLLTVDFANREMTTGDRFLPYYAKAQSGKPLNSSPTRP
jgi:3-isopropylmalate dehydratase small subunit